MEISLFVPQEKICTLDIRMVNKNASTLLPHNREIYASINMEYVSYCIHFSCKLLCVILVASLKCSLWWVECIVASSGVPYVNITKPAEEVFFLHVLLCAEMREPSLL